MLAAASSSSRRGLLATARQMRPSAASALGASLASSASASSASAAAVTAAAAASAARRAMSVLPQPPLPSPLPSSTLVPVLAPLAPDVPLPESNQSVDSYFGSHVFDRRTMKRYLSNVENERFHAALAAHRPIDFATADAIANALLRWATERGATHYTHWFQPITGTCAEKHDTFLDTLRDGETPLVRFTGKQLIMGEPDGSSFPSGGLRATHVARGYTAWDPHSPPFVLQSNNGACLYIPSCFFSWDQSYALDEKIPLLRSEVALARESMRLFAVLEETKHTRVHMDAGLEQEFFLIDREYFMKRPDLMLTGRTLLGTSPPKGQELEDQYFGPCCLTFGTPVLYADGHVGPCEDVKTGDVLVGAQGRKSVVSSVQKTNAEGGADSLLPELVHRIHTSHGVYDVTGQHRITAEWCSEPAFRAGPAPASAAAESQADQWCYEAAWWTYDGRSLPVHHERRRFCPPPASSSSSAAHSADAVSVRQEEGKSDCDGLEIPPSDSCRTRDELLMLARSLMDRESLPKGGRILHAGDLVDLEVNALSRVWDSSAWNMEHEPVCRPALLSSQAESVASLDKSLPRFIGRPVPLAVTPIVNIAIAAEREEDRRYTVLSSTGVPHLTHNSAKYLDCIHDFEVQCWKLGIPIQTRHREVAPGQYEIAPKFAPANVGTDRNLLLMDVLKRTARKHGLAALLHEKPFAGVNGSGKHNNWSLGTNDVPSLLDPGLQPEKNIRFLMFLAATLRAVDLHADLMRVAISGVGNDHRLGANEAPPAIVSAYLGDDIEQSLERFIGGSHAVSAFNTRIDLGIGTLPDLHRVQTDRNRTSTFAFTGNKFEFRAVGSSHNPSRSNQVLNTIVAESVAFFADEIAALKAKGMSIADAQVQVTRDSLKKHSRIIFNGNGYSAEWAAEAARRGLPNLRTTPDALDTFYSEKNVRLFEGMKVLTRAELLSRSQILFEDYTKRISIEGKVLAEMARTRIAPAAFAYQKQLADSIAASEAVLGQTATASAAASSTTPSAPHPQRELLTRLNRQLSALLQGAEEVARVVDQAHDHPTPAASAHFLETNLKPLMRTTRIAADELETIIPAKEWPLPTYHQMLFHQD